MSTDNICFVKRSGTYKSLYLELCTLGHFHNIIRQIRFNLVIKQVRTKFCYKMLLDIQVDVLV